MWRKQIKEDYKNRKHQAVIFGGNSRPNCTPLYPRMVEKIQIQGQIKLLLDEFV